MTLYSGEGFGVGVGLALGSGVGVAMAGFELGKRRPDWGSVTIAVAKIKSKIPPAADDQRPREEERMSRFMGV
jgi:hypothetical protein